MPGWTFIYDKDFTHVYDKDFAERVDLSWDGEDLTISTPPEGVVLDLDKVIALRKALQWVERRAKKETPS